MVEKEVMMSRKTLPGPLVEKIIAMMPFPSIFKARCLSKSWLARFSSISSLHVEEEKWLATSFQKEVGKWSNNWDTFCPVLYDRVDNRLTNLEAFVAYNRASQNWSRIPSLSFLPQGLSLEPNPRQIEGPLLYGFAVPEARLHGMRHCFVANVLTRSWRELPPRPDALVTIVLFHKLVIDPSSQTFKVILFCVPKGGGEGGGVHYYCAQIFDSKLDAWSNKNVEVSAKFVGGYSTSVYLNGVFYVVASSTPQILWAFNLEEGSMEKLTLSLNNGDMLRADRVNLVVCNVNCLMLVTSHREPLPSLAVKVFKKVFKIELGERRLVPLTMCPSDGPFDLDFYQLPPAGDGNWILFSKKGVVASPPVGEGYRSPTTCRPKGESFRVMAYDVDKNVWTWFHVPEKTRPPGFGGKTYIWVGSSFRPGLSPFVAV